jgi:hypothetical protein
MTLVEVIGGLALLATLLVALLLARGRFTHQAALADRRLAAIGAADALLTSWHQDPASLMRGGSGTIAGNDDLFWRTHIVDSPAVNQLDAQVVRLEILDNRQQILTSVEFVADSNLAKAVNLQQTIRKRAKAKR